MRDGYQTDERLLDAIEAITGGDLDASDGYPEDSDDPAVALWRDGGRDDELREWLDANRPGWRADAPLSWGSGELTLT